MQFGPTSADLYLFRPDFAPEFGPSSATAGRFRPELTYRPRTCQAGQHYDTHRDYWDPREFPDLRRFTNHQGFWHQRHATLLWYLQAPEEGGETWFPRAHGGPVPWGEWTACDGRGAKLSPANATAVLFYNLRADGGIDEFSWHCGCPWGPFSSPGRLCWRSGGSGPKSGHRHPRRGGNLGHRRDVAPPRVGPVWALASAAGAKLSVSEDKSGLY